MIASLTGTVSSVFSNSIILEVSGVGYLVNVTPAVSVAATVGTELKLHTELIVREDSQTLYGFSTFEDLQLFQLLLTVSGVGPKSALAAVSALTPEQIGFAVQNEDDSVFKSVPGIGSKTAKLIIVQLAGKIGSLEIGSVGNTDLVRALIGLGFNEKQATRAIEQTQASNMPTSDGLRAALQYLSKQG